jgi:hypothetical protein
MPNSIYNLTAKELARDISTLLYLYRKGKLHEAVVRQAIKGACWWVSNGQGKKDDCDLWSEKALSLRQANSKWDKLGLVHEHIVPRKYIQNRLMCLEDPTESNVERLLSLSQVCVVAPDEDQMLRKKGYRDKPITNDSGELNIEGRYHAVGIQIAKKPFSPKNG